MDFHHQLHSANKELLHYLMIKVLFYLFCMNKIVRNKLNLLLNDLCNFFIVYLFQQNTYLKLSMMAKNEPEKETHETHY